MDNELPPPNPPPASPASLPPTPPPPLPPFIVAKKPKTSRGWKIATLVLAILLTFSLLSNMSHMFFDALLSSAGSGSGGDVRLQEVTIEHNGASDKIAVIPVEGIITSSSIDGGGYSMVELIEDQLKLAAKDHRVKAVLLKVNSPGGEVLASDDIYNALLRFQREHDKPVIASMGNLAASGGYYVSAPCRWIVANELTITGSIGVIMHAYNYRGLMNKVGLRPMIFKSGRFKDMLSGEKDLEKLSPAEQADVEEEGAMVKKLVDETFNRFKTVVAEGRKEANDLNKSNKNGATGRILSAGWTDRADGRILSGKEAYEHGFVDELGSWRTAISRAKKLAGIDKADLITYQMPFSLGNLFNLFGKSNAKSLKIDVGFEVPRLQSGLYYLAPSFLR